MPATVLLHYDRTECHHDGPPLGTFGDDSGPVCADGQPIRWVQFGSYILTVDDAHQKVIALAAMVFHAMTPLVTGCAGACARVSADPAVRALAAAGVHVDEARAEAEQRARDMRPAPASQASRGFVGDPCGSGPVQIDGGPAGSAVRTCGATGPR